MLFICLTTKRAVGVFWYTHFFVANDRHFFHHFQIFPSFSLLVSIFFVILYPCISLHAQFICSFAPRIRPSK